MVDSLFSPGYGKTHLRVSDATFCKSITRVKALERGQGANTNTRQRTRCETNQHSIRCRAVVPRTPPSLFFLGPKPLKCLKWVLQWLTDALKVPPSGKKEGPSYLWMFHSWVLGN